MIPKTQGLLFDLGDTILEQISDDYEAGAARVMQLSQKPIALPPAEVIRVFGGLYEEHRQRCRGSWLEYGFRTFFRLVFDRLGAEFGLSPEKLEEEFWQAGVRMKPEPGVREALKKFHELGLPLGIVSNTPFCGEVLEKELEKHELLDFFQFVMSSADYGLRKPDPELLLTAASRLGVEPGHIWFVGDWRVYDVAAARSAGMTSVYYHRKERPDEGPQPDVVVGGWEQLQNLVIKSF